MSLSVMLAVLVDAGGNAAALLSSEAGEATFLAGRLKVNEIHLALSLLSGPEKALSCSYSLDQ